MTAQAVNLDEVRPAAASVLALGSIDRNDSMAVTDWAEGFCQICGTRSFPPRNSAGFQRSVHRNKSMVRPEPDHDPDHENVAGLFFSLC